MTQERPLLWPPISRPAESMILPPISRPAETVWCITLLLCEIILLGSIVQNVQACYNIPESCGAFSITLIVVGTLIALIYPIGIFCASDIIPIWRAPWRGQDYRPIPSSAAADDDDHIIYAISSPEAGVSPSLSLIFPHSHALVPVAPNNSYQQQS